MSDSNLADLGGHIRQRRRIIFLSVGVLGVLAAGSMLFLLATRVLQVAITPVDADLAAELQGGEGVAIFGRRMLLYADDGSVLVSAPGFAPREVSLSRDDESPVAVELKPLPGQVSIIVNSSTAFLVRIDDKVVSSDREFEVELEPGNHVVRVEGRDIKPYEQEIEVEGRGRSQTYEFTPLPSASATEVMLSVSARPASSRILIDGVAVGTGRFEGPVSGGRHDVRIEAENHEPHVRTIDLETDNLDLGTIELSPNPARISLTSSPSGATVLVDGRFQGSTPLEFTLPAGKEYGISVRKARQGTAADVLTPAPGARITRHYELSDVLYRAEVVANMTAEIAVNGQPRGSTPLSVEVRAGDRITASADGYASKPSEVLVKSVGGDDRQYAFALMEPAVLAYEEADEETTAFGKVRLRKFPPLKLRAPAGESETIEITLSRPFYMGKHEVTVGDFRAFAGGSAASKQTDHPATSVSWDEAVRFCNWLSAKVGLPPAYSFADDQVQLDPRSLGFRLPTESEWVAVASYDVARREPIGPYPWGKSEAIPRAFDNFAGREMRDDNPRHLESHTDNHVATAPVTAYPPNANGLHGIAGNVSEWVYDFYRNSFGSGTPLVDWPGPNHGIDRVVRGANFTSDSLSQLRLDHRDYSGIKKDTVGFRVARWIY